MCAGRMDAGRLTPMGWGVSAGKGQEAALQHSSHPVPKYRENPPSPGSQGPLLKASLDTFSANPAFFSRCPESLTPWSRNRLCLFEGKSSCKGTAFYAEIFPSLFECSVEQKSWGLCSPATPKVKSRRKGGSAFPTLHQELSRDALLPCWHCLQQDTTSTSLWALMH